MYMLIYDCEIIKAIPPRNDAERLPDIEYCDGWRDFNNMGISVIGAYDYAEDRYRVFCKDNFEAFVQLAQARRIISFNGHQFDDKLCHANGMGVDTDYDLLAEVWVAAGLSRTYDGPSHAGYSLDALGQANGAGRKSGHGALAPVLWQQGKVGSVIDYCLQDVRVTKRLIDDAMRFGGLFNPKKPEKLALPSPNGVF